MIHLDSSICLRLREARRLAKLSQAEVAAEVGCKQSALSMFEQGDGTKLNEAVVKKLAQKFGVDLKGEDPAESVKTVPVTVSSPLAGRGFCPNPHCPTNHAYAVEGRALVRPDRAAADPVGGRFCAFCGEALIKSCPNCGRPVHDGAVCSFCGEPYIPVVQ